jgi:membrane associated rhomboid family serine protease
MRQQSRRLDLQSAHSTFHSRNWRSCLARRGIGFRPEIGFSMAQPLSLGPGVTFIIFSALAVAVVLRVSTAAERERALKFVLALGREVKDAAALNREKCEPFQETLRARSRWAVLTPALVVVHALVLWRAFREPGAIAAAETLTAWGGNLAPLTTNGQWWRIPSSVFLHTGVVHFLVTSAALLQVGSLLERLIGRTTVVVAYAAAGIFAGLASIWAAPMAVNAGASASVFSLYGLLLVVPIRNWRDAESVRIPRAVWKRLVPVAVLFSAYSLANDALVTSAEILGLATGFVCGLVLLWEPGEEPTEIRRITVTSGAALFIAAAAAVPLRGVTDVRPEIERLAGIETKTAKSYQAASENFKKRKITAEALAEVINGEILPELQTAQARFASLKGVPAEHRPLAEGAQQYLRLRTESWHLRAEALRKSNAATLRAASSRPASASTEHARRRVEASHQTNLFTFSNADASERASLEALSRIRPN